MVNESDLYKQIGLRVKNLREQCGISQHELALRCEIETSNLCRIEAGNTNVTVKSLLKISTALNIPFYRLTEGLK